MLSKSFAYSLLLFQSFSLCFLSRALRHHPLKEGFWILAASWEYNHHENSVAARTLFQRGLRLLPESVLLWSQYFLFELAVANQIRLKYEKSIAAAGNTNFNLNEEQMLLAQGAIPKLVLENALKSPISNPLVLVEEFLNVYQLGQVNLPEVKALLEENYSHYKITKSQVSYLTATEIFVEKLSHCRSEGDIISIEPEFLSLYTNLARSQESLDLYSTFLEISQRFIALDITYHRLSTKILPSVITVPLYLRILSRGTSLKSFQEKLLEWMAQHEPSSPSNWLSLIAFVHESTRGMAPQKVLQLYQKATLALGHSAEFIMAYRKIVQ